MNVPMSHACYLLTTDETHRLAACTAKRARFGDCGLTWPTPPTTADGAPDHTRRRVEGYTTAYEAATTLAERVAAARDRIERLRRLVAHASKLDPVGVGSYAGTDLRAIVDGLPRRADYQADSAWVDAYEAAGDVGVSSLECRMRAGFHGEVE